MSTSIPDYCDTPDEIAKNPEAKKYIALCANGNPDAFAFGWAFWCFEHCMDDLIDKDKQASAEVIVKSLLSFVDALSNNSFYEKCKTSLYPLIVQACARWLDGDELSRSSNEQDRIRGEVVRCGDIEIFLHIAYLTGGWDYMRSIKQIRIYDRGTK
jgi:hypothetical protein